MVVMITEFLGTPEGGIHVVEGVLWLRCTFLGMRFRGLAISAVSFVLWVCGSWVAHWHQR